MVYRLCWRSWFLARFVGFEWFIIVKVKTKREREKTTKLSGKSGTKVSY